LVLFCFSSESFLAFIQSAVVVGALCCT